MQTSSLEISSVRTKRVLLRGGKARLALHIPYHELVSVDIVRSAFVVGNERLSLSQKVVAPGLCHAAVSHIGICLTCCCR